MFEIFSMISLSLGGVWLIEKKYIEKRGKWMCCDQKQRSVLMENGNEFRSHLYSITELSVPRALFESNNTTLLWMMLRGLDYPSPPLQLSSRILLSHAQPSKGFSQAPPQTFASVLLLWKERSATTLSLLSSEARPLMLDSVSCELPATPQRLPWPCCSLYHFLLL